MCSLPFPEVFVCTTFPHSYSCPELLCTGMDISHKERGWGPSEGRGPSSSSSLAHRPVFNPGLGPAFLPPTPQHIPPSRKQMRKALGAGGAGLSGRSCWAPVPACCFLLPMPTGASRNGVAEAWLPGCLAQGPAVGLLPSETPHPFPGMLVWAAGRSLPSDHGQLLVPPEMGLLAGKLQASERAGGALRWNRVPTPEPGACLQSLGSSNSMAVGKSPF